MFKRRVPEPPAAGLRVEAAAGQGDGKRTLPQREGDTPRALVVTEAAASATEETCIQSAATHAGNVAAGLEPHWQSGRDSHGNIDSKPAGGGEHFAYKH